MIIYRYKKKHQINQRQIPDYFGQLKIIIFDMSIPSQARAARITLFPKQTFHLRGRPKKATKINFGDLRDYFISKRPAMMGISYLKRFPKFSLHPTEIGRRLLSPFETILYWEVTTFHGFFDDIFRTTDCSIWNTSEIQLHRLGLLREIPCLHDMLVFECARIQTGQESYTQFYRSLAFFNPQGFRAMLYRPDFLPNEQDFSDFYHLVPLDLFQQFHQQLIREMMQDHVLSFRIMIWDCQFTHSNSSDYIKTQTGRYSDRDTWVGRHNNRFLGVGYFISTLYLYCGDLIVPVFITVFPANTSDKDMFHDTIICYQHGGLPKPEIILGDCGGYSLKNQRFLASLNIIGVLNAPKTVKNQPLMEIDDAHRFNRNFLPPTWTEDDVRWLCNLRTVIERQFSHNNVVYHARHQNVREIDQVAKHREMIVILDCLKILACIRLGRGDLLRISTSFSLLRKGIFGDGKQDQMKKAGFGALIENESIDSDKN